MKYVEGGITAAQGFTASGVYCGIRKNKTKKDLALIMCEKPCAAAAVYTQNLVKGAPIIVTEKHLKNKKAQAIICNSGNANTCNDNGEEIAENICRIVEKVTGISANDVIVASTGVIGQKLSIEPFEKGIPFAKDNLSKNGKNAATAIMTTDTTEKECAVEFEIKGKKCKIGGIAKGSGMIHPNMATLLVFITTDTAISGDMLNKAIKEDVKNSFNMVSVDGDTSTNDMMAIMASGIAGNEVIDKEGENYEIFKKALNMVTINLCKKIAKDGEGATKLLECRVSGAKDEESAKKIVKSVIGSSLLKAAMFGADANWGRVLCAIGYSGTQTNVSKIDVEFQSKSGTLKVCSMGSGIAFDEEEAKKILSEEEIIISVTCRDGDGEAKGWGCDLTYDYVKINGDYRT